MAITKGVEKVVGIEGFNFNILKETVKKLNESGVLEKPIKVVAVGKDKLVDEFIKGIESVPPDSEQEKAIPTEAIKLYNDYVEVMENKKIALENSGDGTSTEKKTGKKSKAKKEKNRIKTRTESFIDVVNNLNNSVSLDEFAALINNDYIKAGGKDNLKQSKHLIMILLPCAVGFGKVSVDGNIIVNV